MPYVRAYGRSVARRDGSSGADAGSDVDLMTASSLRGLPASAISDCGRRRAQWASRDAHLSAGHVRAIDGGKISEGHASTRSLDRWVGGGGPRSKSGRESPARSRGGNCEILILSPRPVCAPPVPAPLVIPALQKMVADVGNLLLSWCLRRESNVRAP